MMARPNRNPANDYHHGDLRAALVEAASAQVERAGPESVSLNAIAKALGVSQAAPYRHFATRDDLLEAVATAAFARFNAEIAAALASVTGTRRVAAAAHAYTRIGFEHSGLYRLMYNSHLVERTTVGSPLQLAVEAGFHIWLTAFDPALAVAERERIALKFWIALHGIVMLADQGFLPLKTRRISTEELIADLVAETQRELADAAR